MLIVTVTLPACCSATHNVLPFLRLPGFDLAGRYSPKPVLARPKKQSRDRLDTALCAQHERQDDY
jgi:hypothetical protein